MGYKKITQLPTILTGMSSTDKLVIVVSGTTYKTTVGALITVGTSGTSGASGTSGINGTAGTSGYNGTSGTSGVDGISPLSGMTEYIFQTTDDSDHQVQYDYGGTDFNKAVAYDVKLLVSNASNGDLWYQHRQILIAGQYLVTPTYIVLDDNIGTGTVGSSFSSATFEPLVNTFTAGIYNIVWMANGVNGVTLNWKVQINSIYI